jgi:hypothetical protein
MRPIAPRRPLVLLLLLVLGGGHWFALQSVAWLTMLVGNLGTAPISQAVRETFDGKHPCALCDAIAAAKKSDKKSEATTPPARLEFLPPTPSFAFVHHVHFRPASPSGSLRGIFLQPPPTPPPRLIPA